MSLVDRRIFQTAVLLMEQHTRRQPRQDAIDVENEMNRLNSQMQQQDKMQRRLDEMQQQKKIQECGLAPSA
jgi:hypothetical protein